MRVPNADADTIRILVSTDNHVGYGERDPIRKDDSWRSFDEAMNIARQRDVDMVLLAGDLFHDNSKLFPRSLRLPTVSKRYGFFPTSSLISSGLG